MRLSITARIALLSIGLAIISNFALSAFVWKQAQSDAREAVQRETIEQADALIAVWRDGGDAILAPAIRSALAPADMSQVLAILDEHGNRLVGLAPMRFAPPLERTRFGSPGSVRTVAGRGATPAIRSGRSGADGCWSGATWT